MSGKLKKSIGIQFFAQSPLHKNIFGTSTQTVRKNRFFFLLSNFAWFLDFSLNILYWIALFQQENFLSDTTWKTKSRQNSSEPSKNTSEQGRKAPESVHNHLKSCSSDWASFTNVVHLRWKLTNVVVTQMIVTCNKKLRKQKNLGKPTLAVQKDLTKVYVVQLN